VQVGAIIQFGAYDWRVLDVQDGRALILSDRIIANRAFRNESGLIVTWADSDLRAWLNGEFFNNFTSNDRERIIPVTHSSDVNPWCGWRDGANTRDYIFPLCIDEVTRYFGDGGELLNDLLNDEHANLWSIDDEFNENRIAFQNYDFVYDTGFDWELEAKENEAWWWWIRGKDNGRNGGVFVNAEGVVIIVDDHMDSLIDVAGGVRPAMWINLE
jgi:hypothetical protein